ncbi:hypothetical protein Nepgr_019571 [Nepenthes gracilis]|uniref:Uncharacterized protein n=1 Tax=Nepenthes gracilis TaxID=150966 RepID=A0AAD3XVD1_NEPGR|nr:hypothetical protein Nepgr_019571 [Nepenthes gracilis]
MNSHAHRLPKNSNPVVDAAGCNSPYSDEPTGSKATKQVPVDSNPVSPKAKLDSVVLPVPSSGLHGGLEDQSSNSDSCMLHQTDACAASVNNPSSGHYHWKPNGCLLDCIPQQSYSALEAEDLKPEQQFSSLALESGDNEVGHGATSSQMGATENISLRYLGEAPAATKKQLTSICLSKAIPSIATTSAAALKKRPKADQCGQQGIAAAKIKSIVLHLQQKGFHGDIQQEEAKGVCNASTSPKTKDRPHPTGGFAGKSFARTGAKDHIARHTLHRSSGRFIFTSPMPTTPHSIQKGSQPTPMNQPRVTTHQDKTAQRPPKEPAARFHEHAASPTQTDDEAKLHHQDQDQPRMVSAKFSKKEPAKEKS